MKNLTAKKILIADDERIFLGLLAKQVRGEGFSLFIDKSLLSGGGDVLEKMILETIKTSNL